MSEQTYASYDDLVQEITRLRAEVEKWERYDKEMVDPQVAALSAEVERLREEADKVPTREWYEKRCAWYGAEYDRLKAALAAHQAVVRELAKALKRSHACATLRDDGICDGCFVSEALVVAARTEGRDVL